MLEKMNKSIYVKRIISLPREADDLTEQFKALTDNSALFFVENLGQTNSKVQYHSSNTKFNAFFKLDEIIFSFIMSLISQNSISQGEPDLISLFSAPLSLGQPMGLALGLKFIGCSQRTKIKAQNKNPWTVNYYEGNFPDNWYDNVSTYNSITYQNLWHGIDLSVEGTCNEMKYHFTVQPSAKAKNIRLSYEGADKLHGDDQGGILIDTALVRLVHRQPEAYQIINKKKQQVKCSLKLHKQLMGGILIYVAPGKGYNPKYPLMIDMTMNHINLTGDYGNYHTMGLAKGCNGDLYSAGCSYSLMCPASFGIFDPSSMGSSNFHEVFAAKFSLGSKVPLYFTYLNGSGVEQCLSIASDSCGDAYITGTTSSKNFPVTTGAFDTLFNGDYDAFTAKLSESGGNLVYSTFLGGNGNDISYAITVDRNGSAYVTGQTSSPCFPTTPGVFRPLWNGGIDAFISKLSPDGSTLVFSTFLGGILDDTSFAIALDNNGNVYTAGFTCSPDFPNPQGITEEALPLNAKLFLSKLSFDGSRLLFSKVLKDENLKQ